MIPPQSAIAALTAALSDDIHLHLESPNYNPHLAHHKILSTYNILKYFPTPSPKEYRGEKVERAWYHQKSDCDPLMGPNPQYGKHLPRDPTGHRPF